MTTRATRMTLGASAALSAGLLLAIAVPLSASAHVTIDPGQAAAGSYALVSVKVPNESETATTNRVELQLPTDTPFTSVSYVPVAGWTAELVRSTLPAPVEVGETTITEAVTSVVWTAQPGSEIESGQLRVFPVSLGAVPDVGSVVLPALQGYTDGTTVAWTDTADDADHPAPVLYVNDAPGSVEMDAAASTKPDPAEDVLARVLGIGGLVVGAVGIVLAVASRRKAVR
jgi:uncharacterized protein YcnI